MRLCFSSDSLVFSVPAHVITTLLLDEVYPPLGINVWLNVNCILLVGFFSEMLVILTEKMLLRKIP